MKDTEYKEGQRVVVEDGDMRGMTGTVVCERDGAVLVRMDATQRSAETMATISSRRLSMIGVYWYRPGVRARVKEERGLPSVPESILGKPCLVLQGDSAPWCMFDEPLDECYPVPEFLRPSDWSRGEDRVAYPVPGVALVPDASSGDGIAGIGLLPLAMKVAARTVGLDIVPTPDAGRWKRGDVARVVHDAYGMQRPMRGMRCTLLEDDDGTPWCLFGVEMGNLKPVPVKLRPPGWEHGDEHRAYPVMSTQLEPVPPGPEVLESGETYSKVRNGDGTVRFVRNEELA